MLANRAGEGGGGEGRRGGLINSISQASAFFTDVRSIFLPFLRGWRLIVENRSVVIGKLDSREKKVAIASRLISIHPIRTGAKSIGGRRLCALSSPPLSRLSIRSSFFAPLSSYIYISLSTVPRWWPSFLSPPSPSSSRSLRRSRFIPR